MTPRPHSTAAQFYPSIAASAFGRVLGRAMNILPIPVGRLKLSHLVMAPIVAPFAVVAYAFQKLLGDRYLLTADALEVWPVVGGAAKHRIELTNVAAAEVTVRPGQAFFHAGDVQLLDIAGQTLATLEGVPNPGRVVASILESQTSWTRTSRVQETLRRRLAVG